VTVTVFASHHASGRKLTVSPGGTVFTIATDWHQQTAAGRPRSDHGDQGGQGEQGGQGAQGDQGATAAPAPGHVGFAHSTGPRWLRRIAREPSDADQ
jgi:hypothetical protein